MRPLPAPVRRRQRGASLVESLIAFAVMALGMVAVIGLQGTLRFHSDLARQRSEALRLAEDEIEALRSFVRVVGNGAPVPAYTDILPGRHDDVGPASSTHYTLDRDVTDSADGVAFKTVVVTVSWQDRHDDSVQLTLPTVIPALDPAASALLALAASGTPLRQPLGHPGALPYPSSQLGGGRRAFKPVEDGDIAWVFAADGDRIASRCTVAPATRSTSLADADLHDCTAVSGLLLAGFVRFDTDGSADPERPDGAALNLDLAFTPDDGHVLRSDCRDDAPATRLAGPSRVRYACLLELAPGFADWSGRLSVQPVGWSYGLDAAGFRLCRYSADHDRSGRIDNAEHPDRYAGAGGHLVNQNFLVVRGDERCPVDGPARPEFGDWVDASTVQHEPPGV